MIHEVSSRTVTESFILNKTESQYHTTKCLPTAHSINLQSQMTRIESQHYCPTMISHYSCDRKHIDDRSDPFRDSELTVLYTEPV